MRPGKGEQTEIKQKTCTGTDIEESGKDHRADTVKRQLCKGSSAPEKYRGAKAEIDRVNGPERWQGDGEFHAFA
jgi:hypothetical protein